MPQWYLADEAWDVFELQLQPGYERIRIWWLDWKFRRSLDLASMKNPEQLT